jgi:hypothetical protein
MMSTMMIGVHNHLGQQQQQQQEQQQGKEEQQCDSNNHDDCRLSELAESSLNISLSQDVRRCNNTESSTLAAACTTLALVSPGLYSNGLINMTTSTSTCTNTMDVVDNNIGTTAAAAAATVVVDSGLLSSFHPGWWDDWESRRRSESSGAPPYNNSHTNFMKKHHQKQLKKLKRIKRKTVNEKHVKVASLMKFRRRRLRLEHTLGCGGINNKQHLQDNHGSISKKNSSAASSILIVTTNNASSSSRNSLLLSKATTLQRRKTTRVVRFRDDDITDATIEWKREQQNQKCTNNNNNGNTINTSKLGLELHREQKKTQRELLDLQVGMNCMGL